MPVRNEKNVAEGTETPNPMKAPVKTSLTKKAEELLKIAEVADQLKEMEERQVAMDDENTLTNVVFMSFSDGKESVKECLYAFAAQTKTFDDYAMELLPDGNVLCIYKN